MHSTNNKADKNRTKLGRFREDKTCQLPLYGFDSWLFTASKKVKEVAVSRQGKQGANPP